MPSDDSLSRISSGTCSAFSAPRTRDFVRISIGTRADREALIRATDEILREAGYEKGID